MHAPFLRPFLIGALFALPEVAVGAGLTIDDIVSNVRRNERLYENHDVTLHYEYTIGARTPVKFAGGSKEVVDEHSQMRYVTQNEVFRIDKVGNKSLSNATILSTKLVRTFDGEKTIIYDQDAIANIVRGREGEGDGLFPHMFLLQRMVNIPLSVYLSGTDAIRALPNSPLHDQMAVRAEYHGEVQYLDLKCHKVSITTAHAAGGDRDRWELWISEDRNYLPIRMFGWTFSCSRDVPLSEGEVTELREVAPDIWFPFAARVTAYDRNEIAQSQVQKMRWRAEYVVSEVSLEPKVDPSYFKDVGFADGTAVYEVTDGEIMRSYRIGTPEVSKEHAFKAWWLVGINALIVIGAVVYVLARRRGGATRHTKYEAVT